MSEKITSTHLARKAVLYVRQSSAHQVLHNQESRRLQYAMTARLHELGWPDVDVVDEDLGKTAAGSAQRRGFERMTADVCLGRIGVVAARELSRLARNSREWQGLIEVCRVTNTLLVDHETVYDPGRGNDRLLLGLKGSLNEYELDVLRLRATEARHEKARRGELVIKAPVGYIKTHEGRLEKDPDGQVREKVGLVFRKFLELGAVRPTLLWLVGHDLELPGRQHTAAGWKTVWKRPAYAAVLRMLRSPVYAGIYVYGRTEVVTEFRDGKTRRRRKARPAERWIALIPDHHEGYIGRDEFDRIQEMISKNAQSWLAARPGAAKGGPALLAGLLCCRRCGGRLMVSYGGRGDVHRYVCRRGTVDNAERRCFSIAGRSADEAVSREVLRAVEPAAAEAALVAAREAAAGRDEVVEALALDLQAARYAADRAWRQYDAADPENRLVAGELERRWNVCLARVRELEDRIEQEEARRDEIAPPAEGAFEKLARDLDGVWNDPATDVRLKKRIVQTLIEQVIADVEEVGDADRREVVLILHWKGGVHTELRLRRRRRGENSRHTPVETVDAVRALALVCSDEVIAGALSRNGLRTGRGKRWTREAVTSLRSRRGIGAHSPERKRAEGWMNLTEAAAHVGLCPKTLREAAAEGKVQAIHPLCEGPWVFKREDLDGPDARKVIEGVRHRRRGGAGQAPGQLSLLQSRT